eukprot:jgi/Mesvir1/10552/Mv21779-RA.1
MDGLPLDFTSRAGKAAAASKASSARYFKRKKEDEGENVVPAQVGDGGNLADAPLDFGQNDQDDEVFASIYTTQYGGPGRGRQDVEPAAPSRHMPEDDEEDIPHTEDGLPLDFTSRSGKAANLRAKAVERMFKKRQEDELRCRLCGEMGHFAQGCPSTLKGGKAGAGSAQVTGRLTFYNPKIRPRIIGTGGAVVQGLEKESGCKITLESLPGDPAPGFTVRISGPSQEAVDKATRAVNEIAAQSEQGWARDAHKVPGGLPMGPGMGGAGAAASRGLWQGGVEAGMGGGGYVPGMAVLGSGHQGAYGALPGGGPTDADITRTIAQQIAERRQAGGLAPLGLGGVARGPEGGGEWEQPGAVDTGGGALPSFQELEEGLAEELRQLDAAQRQAEAELAATFAAKRRRLQESYAERRARVERWMPPPALPVEQDAHRYGQQYVEGGSQGYRDAGGGDAYAQGYAAASASAAYGTGVAGMVPAASAAGHRTTEYGHYNVGVGEANLPSSYPATGSYAGYGVDATGYAAAGGLGTGYAAAGGLGTGTDAYGQYNYGA